MLSHIIMQFPADRERARFACQPVLGVPLFLRNCLTLIGEGYTHLVLLAPPQLHRHIHDVWSHGVRTTDATLTLIATDDEGLIPPDQLFAVHAVIAERCVLLHAITMITVAWVHEALGPALRHGHALRGGQRIDKASLHEQLPHLQTMTLQGPEPRALPRHYLHLQYASDIPRWEWALSEQIRHGDIGWFAKHLNKRLSLPISRWLARRRISPHLITFVNLLIGLGAGLAAAGHSYWSLLLAGTLFQAASVLDGCDGEVAKFTFRASRAGQLIDTIGDTLTLLAFFVGLCVHLDAVHGRAATIGLAAALFSGVFAFIGIMFCYLHRHGNSWSLVAFDRLFVRPRLEHQHTVLARLIHYGKLSIKKDCFSWVFWGLAVCGWLPIAPYLAVTANWLAVLGLLWLYRLPITWVDASSPETDADSRDQIPRHR